MLGAWCRRAPHRVSCRGLRIRPTVGGCVDIRCSRTRASGQGSGSRFPRLSPAGVSAPATQSERSSDPSAPAGTPIAEYALAVDDQFAAGEGHRTASSGAVSGVRAQYGGVLGSLPSVSSMPLGVDAPRLALLRLPPGWPLVYRLRPCQHETVPAPVGTMTCQRNPILKRREGDAPGAAAGRVRSAGPGR